MKTKNEIAQEIYGEDFADLTAGQKAAVSREYNAQEDEDTDYVPPFEEETTSPVLAVKASIARIGNNGVKTCMLKSDATIRDLLSQAGIELDSSKEGVLAKSTGIAVNLNSSVVDGEDYVISPEVRSA